MNHHPSDINRLLFHHPNDAAVIEEIVKQYYATMYRVAVSILGDPDEAKDATQDTFIAATTKLDQYQVGTNFKAWLYTIGVNTCRGYLRKRKTRESLTNVLMSIQSFAARPPGPEESVLQDEIRSQLWAQVDKLSEKHRITVILRTMHGLSIREIAQIMQVKEKTVYTRLYDAYRKLRKQLDGKIDYEPIPPQSQ